MRKSSKIMNPSSDDDEDEDEGDEVVEEMQKVRISRGRPSKSPINKPPKGSRPKIDNSRKIINLPQSISVQTRKRDEKDKMAGQIYIRTGAVKVYVTPGLKYYYVKDNGKKTYVTARITNGKLQVYEA